PKTYIAQTKQTPQFDAGKLSFVANVEGSMAGDQVKVIVKDGANEIKQQMVNVNSKVDIDLPNLQAWSPSNPKLYDLDIQLVRKGKVIDQAKSYFAMRKISMGKDKNGIQRMLLNNEFVFQYGPLDQGWRPDGLHTAPSDEALKFDVITTKEITDWTINFDNSRLVNSASGGNFMYTGHILDIHNYPDAAMPDPAIFGDKFILALGEFGGLGLPVDGHTWQQKDNWGYQSF